MKARPTVPLVVLKAREFYTKHGNGCGGVLHIVLDDGNVEEAHVRFCRDEAVKKDDHDAIDICDDLLELTAEERYAVYNGVHGRAGTTRADSCR
jgi:hypothetical protein